ncbi:hypothetical protein OAA67_03580 [Winogradskyella sp.]|nr:hypothetical protein [Winogradskyella sp.]
MSTHILTTFNLVELPNLVSQTFTVIMTICVLLLLINLFLFTRIGKLELIKNTLITRIDDSIQTVDLDTIKTVEISSTNKNHYFMKFDPNFEVLVEMKNGQLNEIKQMFIKNKIEIIDTSFMTKLKKWFIKTEQ